MENKISDINVLVLFLAVTATKPLLDDKVWQCYGYTKRPKHGDIWSKIFPKRFELEDFISREILTMGLIDVLNGIKKSQQKSDIKLLLSIGVIDHILSVTKHVFPPDLFMENLFSTYDSYLKSEKSKIYEPIILKAKNVLNERDFAKFIVGTIRLFTHEADDYLLNSDYIKSFIDKSDIEKSAKERRLKISMSEEMYKKYVPLIEEKILNTDLKK